MSLSLSRSLGEALLLLVDGGHSVLETCSIPAVALDLNLAAADPDTRRCELQLVELRSGHWTQQRGLLSSNSTGCPGLEAKGADAALVHSDQHSSSRNFWGLARPVQLHYMHLACTVTTAGQIQQAEMTLGAAPGWCRCHRPWNACVMQQAAFCVDEKHLTSVPGTQSRMRSARVPQGTSCLNRGWKQHLKWQTTGGSRDDSVTVEPLLPVWGHLLPASPAPGVHWGRSHTPS